MTQMVLRGDEECVMFLPLFLSFFPACFMSAARTRILENKKEKKASVTNKARKKGINVFGPTPKKEKR